MTSSESDLRKSWQKATWVQLLAIAIGVLPSYILPVMAQLQSDQPLSVKDVSFYSIVLGGIMIVVILLLLRYLCDERIRDLNLREGKWWKDILVGIGLSALTLASLILLSNPINSMFPSEPQSGMGDFFNEMVENPWLFAMIMGPMLIIGASVFEELTRVFLLTRLWNISSKKEWKWMAVILSAVLFGLGHMYQGPAGVVLTGISGLIMAIYYLIFGRVAPMMVAHYLHDALQFAMIYIMANAS
jgi:membrane protease YdiL (CAAX protease family)